MNSRRRDIATHCARCGVDGWRSEFTWMSHDDFCRACMDALVAGGLAVNTGGAMHELTERGRTELPGHAAVAECAWCGTPIYQRWIDEKCATLEGHPTCRFCMGTADAGGSA